MTEAVSHHWRGVYAPVGEGCERGAAWAAQVRSSDKTPLLTCLLEGPGGAGKTALAASMGIDSEYPFVKVVSAQNYVGYSEGAKCQAIAKVFDDAYKVQCALHRAA